MGYKFFPGNQYFFKQNLFETSFTAYQCKLIKEYVQLHSIKLIWKSKKL